MYVCMYTYIHIIYNNTYMCTYMYTIKAVHMYTPMSILHVPEVQKSSCSVTGLSSSMEAVEVWEGDGPTEDAFDKLRCSMRCSGGMVALATRYYSIYSIPGMTYIDA